MMTKYEIEKYDVTEPIKVGDVVTYFPTTKKVTRAVKRHPKDDNLSDIIGVCTAVKDESIIVTNTGIVDVNVKGITCIGDKLTISEKYGIAKAIRYDQDISQFGFTKLGKVIGLYNSYNIVKVLLDIE